MSQSTSTTANSKPLCDVIVSSDPGKCELCFSVEDLGIDAARCMLSGITEDLHDLEEEWESDLDIRISVSLYRTDLVIEVTSNIPERTLIATGAAVQRAISAGFRVEFPFEWPNLSEDERKHRRHIDNIYARREQESEQAPVSATAG